jgi:general secretion pathway protein J
LSQRKDWQEAWSRAQTWGQTPSAAERPFEVNVRTLSQWQIFYYRGAAWTNPLSSEGTANTATNTPSTPAPSSAPSPAQAPAVLPDGIRLVLDLPNGQGLDGKITLDWIKPTLTGNAS